MSSRFSIHLGHTGEEAVLVLANLQIAQLLATHGFLEDGLNLRVGILLVIEFLDAVVAKLAAVLLEEVMAFLERIY